ncbi:Ldh family oxidoreductase [Devosia rhodophyticola]|uniref:Ldh family oxidoreductase n=1 Tax=Devosia rhodophyticola TaxID=3026423 RepID=A0ABY7Z1M9_9HYPH|nr:Ldh family oxidoreductase [Devosia rhodophyticola]WDR07198.1 Ldh family oxidoreductase [Devosia rhodophyticola]
MNDNVTLTLAAAQRLSLDTLLALGLSPDQATAVTETVIAGQRDECHSHGLYRLIVCAQTIRAGMVALDAVPEVVDAAPAVVQVDARGGYSLLAFKRGLPPLIEKARSQGIAALAINNCVHFSALWPEVEAIAAAGLVGLAMTPSHSWVAPAGGTKPVFGTNPIAFSWPRKDNFPFVFDFATSMVARGEIELHRRAGKDIPLGWGVDGDGAPTTDAAAAMGGAMLTFGEHKGSALAAMIELMAGPLIGDLTSIDSQAHDGGKGASRFTANY